MNTRGVWGTDSRPVVVAHPPKFSFRENPCWLRAFPGAPYPHPPPQRSGRSGSPRVGVPAGPSSAVGRSHLPVAGRLGKRAGEGRAPLQGQGPRTVGARQRRPRLTCLSLCLPWISTKSSSTFTVRSSGEKCFTSRKITNLSRSDRTWNPSARRVGLPGAEVPAGLASEDSVEGPAAQAPVTSTETPSTHPVDRVLGSPNSGHKCGHLGLKAVCPLTALLGMNSGWIWLAGGLVMG